MTTPSALRSERVFEMLANRPEISHAITTATHAASGAAVICVGIRCDWGMASADILIPPGRYDGFRLLEWANARPEVGAL